MTPLETTLWWIATIGGLAGTALLSGLETGVYCLNRVKLEVRAARGPRAWAARLLRREVEHPERLLASNLVANLFCGDLAATGASHLMAGAGYSDTAIILVNTAILTPIFFVFVESLPKEIFRLEADRLTYSFAGFLSLVRRLLMWTGIVPLIRLLAAGITRLVGGEGEAGLAQTARERIGTLVKDSVATGAISESQVGLVDRALRFQHMTVADEMIPWGKVKSAPAAWSREQGMRLLARERVAFLPLVERSAVGKVVGVVRFNDVFLESAGSLEALSHRPARLTPRMSLPEAVASLRRAEAPVGIVEDGGRPLGLVTLTDLLAPLTGVETGPGA